MKTKSDWGKNLEAIEKTLSQIVNLTKPKERDLHTGIVIASAAWAICLEKTQEDINDQPR